MLYCENCHAPIPEESEACPYCGALNASGGEKKYMERLYNLKGDVEELSRVPGQEYRREMKRIGRIIGMTVLTIAAVAVFACSALFLYRKQENSGPSEEEARARLLWERENFPKLDAMYAEGDYDGILRYVYGNEEGEYNSISNWKHSDFIDVYRWYCSCRERADQIVSGAYDEEDEIECIIDALFLIQERPYITCSEEEKGQIEEYGREIRALLCAELGMREGDLDLLYEESCLENEYGIYFDYATARKKVREYVKNKRK